jgi:transcriptional regulator with XRE-family HTH domain
MRRRRLGLELRRLRLAAGLTGDQVVEQISWAAKSKLSRLENGRSRPDLADILDLLDLYEVTGDIREELIAIAREAGNTRWLRAYPVMTALQRGYAELEAGAVHIREYSATTVPGLLQTPQYARVRIMSTRRLQAVPQQADRDMEAEIEARLARQSILTREVDPPSYEAIIDENALSGRCAPAAVLSGQLIHLRAVGALQNVTLRVLPTHARVADYYQPQHGFSMYAFADPRDLQTVAVEALSSDLILTDRGAASRYAKVYEWLQAAALSPSQTAQWLADHVNTTR